MMREPVSMHEEACMARIRGHQSLLFSYRMPTFLRSMQFVLVPIATSWPLEGLTASFTSGMLWEVRVPPLQANPMLSLQTPPSACFLVGKGLGPLYVSSRGIFLWAVARRFLGKSVGLAFLKKGSLLAPGIQACWMRRAELTWSLL